MHCGCGEEIQDSGLGGPDSALDLIPMFWYFETVQMVFKKTLPSHFMNEEFVISIDIIRWL